MKTFLLKLIPGAAATLALFALAAFAVHAQQNPSPVPVAPRAAAAPAPYIVCGVCGARIAAPQSVLVAAPYYNAQPILVQRDDCQASYYGYPIPPAPVYSLTDYWRADPRLIVPECREFRPILQQRRFIRR